MDAQNYRDRVEKSLVDADYKSVDDAAIESFDSVWRKQTDDPTIGPTQVFVTVVDAESDTDDELIDTAEAFREVLTTVARTEPGSMENLFGYPVFALSDPSEELIQSATEEYTVADRRTSVFPLLYDLSTETLHLHPVPRLKGRGFYEKQKLDAESLFSI